MGQSPKAEDGPTDAGTAHRSHISICLTGSIQTKLLSSSITASTGSLSILGEEDPLTSVAQHQHLRIVVVPSLSPYSTLWKSCWFNFRIHPVYTHSLQPLLPSLARTVAVASWVGPLSPHSPLHLLQQSLKRSRERPSQNMLTLCLNPPWLPSNPKMLPGLDQAQRRCFPWLHRLHCVPPICQALSRLPLPMLFPPPGTVPSMSAGLLPSEGGHSSGADLQGASSLVHLILRHVTSSNVQHNSLVYFLSSTVLS